MCHISAHVRTGSAGSPMDLNNSMQAEEDLRCMKIGSHRAHQQAITVLDSEGGRVLTGSQDHTLKVYRYVQSNEQYGLENFSHIYLFCSGWKINCLCTRFTGIAARYRACLSTE